MSLALPTNTEVQAQRAGDFPAFSGLRMKHTRETVKEALAHIGRLQMLDEYTKHDISHIDSMLKLYDWMIPENVQKRMTPADWLLLALSTYLHDFGMLITRDEFDARDTTEFPMFKRRILDDNDSALQDYRAQIELLESDESERFLYQEFVRQRHAARIRNWLYDDPDPRHGFDPSVSAHVRKLFDGLDQTFRRDVGVVCESHHLDDLHDTSKYPIDQSYGTSDDETANVQYIAILLRTADLLHIDRDRVPSTAALIVNPRNPTSQKEWAKQAAVRRVRAKNLPVADGEDRAPEQDTVEVLANFKEAEGFFGLTSYLNYATDQLDQSHHWAADTERKFGTGYHFPWRKIDTGRIEAEGFETKAFEFSIDQEKILDLLTGHTLYNDTGVVLRELVQNSLDAVRLHAHLHPEEDYDPEVHITWDSTKRILTVTDNGTGMTQDVIERNFLRVGSSRYQDPDFKKQVPDFASISRFGIGVLSAFMIADDVAVFTSEPTEPHARHMNLRDVHGKYLVRHVDRDGSGVPDLARGHGTRVQLNLRPSAKLENVDDLLKHWVVLPGCSVALEIDGVALKIGAESIGEALESTLLDVKAIYQVDGTLVNRFGNPVQVRTEHKEGLDIAYAVAFNEWLQEWEFLRADRLVNREHAGPVFGTCVGGVRVTASTPGFQNTSIAAMANAYGLSAPRTNVARSALERTDQYYALLQNVYETYTGHIANELDTLEKERRASKTFASREAGFLVDALYSGTAVLDSPDHLRAAVRELPAFVVETANVRTRESLADLSNRDEYVTVESTAVSNLESLLSSVKGGSNASLGSIMVALGVDDELMIPTSPLVCGLSPTSLFSRFLRNEWEIVNIKADGTQRSLQAKWARIGETPRWNPGFQLRGLDQQFVAGLDRDATSARQMPEVLLADPGLVSMEGFTEKLVRFHGMLLVLPGHETEQITLLNPEENAGYRRWTISWLLSRLLDMGFGQRRGLSDFSAAAYSRQFDDLMSRLRDAQVFNVVKEDSVVSALQNMDLRVLDVHRWHKRDENSF